LFENFGLGITAEIEDAISQAINTYLPYIDLNSVFTEENPEDNTLNIKISYTILETTETQLLEIALNIGETGTTGPVY